MAEMHPVYLFLDPYLIRCFRLTGSASVDFVLGTLAVAALTLLVGEFTSYLASLAVRRHLARINAEALKYQDLSIKALKVGDRGAYSAANEVANEAFGKSFFLQVAQSAAFFWPVFLSLGWMQARFYGVDIPLPLVGWSVGYLSVFVVLYIASYIVFQRLKRKLWHVRGLPGASPSLPAQPGDPGVHSEAPPAGKPPVG